MEWIKGVEKWPTVSHYLTPHYLTVLYILTAVWGKSLRVRCFFFLSLRSLPVPINNFVLCNYLTVALVNYTFKAHFHRWPPRTPVLRGHLERGGDGRRQLGRQSGGLINALPLCLRLDATHTVGAGGGLRALCHLKLRRLAGKRGLWRPRKSISSHLMSQI